MSNGHQSDSPMRAHSTDEDTDFAKDVQLRAKRLFESRFGKGNMFENLTAGEPSNSVPLSKDAVLERMLASEPTTQPADMDIDSEQPKKPTFDRMKLPHPGYDDYLSKPTPLTVPCMLKMTADGAEYGHFIRSEEKGPLSLLFRIDHGNRALPALKLRLRRSKNSKNTVKLNQPRTYMEADFTWAPGVTTEKDHDGNPIYQLQSSEAYTLEQYNARTQPSARGKGGNTPYSILSKLSADIVNQLVIVHFVGNGAQIHSEMGAKGSFRNNCTVDMVEFINRIFTNERFECIVAFLLPDTLGMNAQQWINENFVETIARDVARRTIPWAPYFMDGDLAINLDMPSIRTFANRMLANFSPSQRQELLAACSVDDSSDKFPDGFIVPEPTLFLEYDKTRTYPMVKLFAVPHATSVVREYQWQYGKNSWLSQCAMQFQVVRTLQAKSRSIRDTELQPRPERSQAQIQQERSFYLCGYLPTGCPVPPENSEWLINWTICDYGDDIILEEDKKKWVAFVRHMSPAEQRQSSADFLLVAQRPPGAVFIPAVDGFDKVSTKVRQLARMEPVIQCLPSERIIESIKEFVSDGRNDLDNIRIPLIFGPEKYKQPVVDLGEGVDNDKICQDACKLIYQEILEILRSLFNEAQMFILEKAMREVENGICLIFGGPGRKKTTTMAYAVLALNLVGHRVLVVAEDNSSLDNFVECLVEAQETMLRLVRGREEYEHIQCGLDEMKFLRHIPPAIEERTLRDTFDTAAATKQHHAGQVFDPHAFQRDSKTGELVRAYAANERILQGCNDIKLSRELDSLNREALLAKTQMDMDRIQADLQRLQADYERTHKQERTFNYPTKASLAWHVSQMEAAPENLDPSVRQLLNSFLEAREACKNEEPSVSKQLHRHNTTTLSEATKALIDSVLEQMDVVACTYVNCATPLMKTCFKPSVVVHEESSRARLGTQTAALVYENVKAHCFVGDPEQMPHRATANGLNEHRSSAAVSCGAVLMDQGNKVHWIDDEHSMHPSRTGKSLSNKRITYAGPDEGGPFGGFPRGEPLTMVKKRAQRAK